MDKPFIYEIRVEGHLADRWSDWFDRLAIRHEDEGQTVLCGPVRDQSALFGILGKIHGLNLILISVTRQPCHSGLT